MIEPEYYNEGTEDIIDAYWNTHSVERSRGFMEGNVWKYTARFPSKNVGIEDLRKAQTYIQKWIDHELQISPVAYPVDVPGYEVRNLNGK